MTPEVREALLPLLGGRGAQRTVAPLCGTIMQDMVGTAQGRWFFDGSEHEDPHLALAHDNVDPGIGNLSIGTSLPGTPAGVYDFVPEPAGRVNADFPRVTADGTTWCYSPRVNRGLHFLVQLVSASRLRIEGVPGIGCGDPAGWHFGTGAVEFAR